MNKALVRQIIAVTLATFCVTGLVHWHLSRNHVQAQRLDVTQKAVLILTHMIQDKPGADILFPAGDLARRYHLPGLSTALKTTKDPSRVFYGDPSLFLPRNRAVILPITIAGSDWKFAAMPERGWARASGTILAVDLALILLGGCVGYFRIRSVKAHHAFMEIQHSLDMSQALSHLGSWSLDLKTNALWGSDETYEIFGLDKAKQPLTMDIVMGMIAKDDRPGLQNAIDQAIAQCGRYIMEHRIIRSNGETAHVEARGAVHCDPDGTAQNLTGTILDITPRKTAENELKARQQQMSAMARASHDALIMIDSADKVMFWSDMAEKMFGWTADEVMGKSLHPLMTLPEDGKKAARGLKPFAGTGTGPVMDSVMEFTAVRKDGSTFPVERSVSAFKIGDAYYAVGGLRDISNRKKKEEQLRRLATTDSLTGLNNRRRFMELMENELKKGQRYAHPFSVIMFDADKFKQINDTFGHDVGDQVLTDISRLTQQQMRETDFSGRLGGEEFAVGLPLTDIKGAIGLAERLRAAFEASVVDAGDGSAIHYTMSFGVACCPPDSPIDVTSLMKQADTALYLAKATGRNRVESHRPDAPGNS